MPILFSQNIRIHFYIALFFSILFIILTLFIYDPYKSKKYKITFKTYYEQLKNSLKIIKKNKNLLWLFLHSALFYVLIKIFAELINQALIEQNFNMVSYGLIFDLATVIKAILLLFSDKIITFFRETNVYLILFIVWIVSMALLTTKNIYIITPVMRIN